MDEEIPIRVCFGRTRWSDTCCRCKHHHFLTKTCAAFPDGIPAAIWNAADGHRSPVDGDHGIQFDPRDMVDPLTRTRDYYEIPDFLLKKP